MFTSTFPNGMSGEEVLAKLEIADHSAVKELHKFGLSFSAYESEQVSEATAFAWLNTEGETVGDIHLDNRTIQGAKGKMELQFLKTAVLWGAEQVLSAVKGETQATDVTDQAVEFKATNLSPGKAEKIKKLAEQMMNEQGTVAGTFKTPYTDTDGDYDMAPFFPTDQLKSAETVKLSLATQMYQPVQGTSGSSRYFVVGISDEVKVAARIKGVSVSIRLEGPALGKQAFSTALKAVGISGGKNGEYASMHIEAPDPITAQKAIGSVLSALPVQWKTPMPTVGHLQGLGS
jgi:hypothetical protein